MSSAGAEVEHEVRWGEARLMLRMTPVVDGGSRLPWSFGKLGEVSIRQTVRADGSPVYSVSLPYPGVLNSAGYAFTAWGDSAEEAIERLREQLLAVQQWVQRVLEAPKEER